MSKNGRRAQAHLSRAFDGHFSGIQETYQMMLENATDSCLGKVERSEVAMLCNEVCKLATVDMEQSISSSDSKSVETSEKEEEAWLDISMKGLPQKRMSRKRNLLIQSKTKLLLTQQPLEDKSLVPKTNKN